MMKHFLLMMMLSAAGFTLAAEPTKVEPKPAEAAKEFILFDGKNLMDWESVDIGASGMVEVEGGLLIINQGDSISGAIYKKAAALPMTNYEISLDAKRLQGVDFFVGLTFPVGDAKHCATLVCGGWGGSVTGISSIDNLDASENNTTSYQRFKDNEWYTIRLRVTKDHLSVWLGDKQIIDEDITGKKIGPRPGPMESYLPLSLTTFATTAAIRNVKLKVIEPEKP